MNSTATYTLLCTITTLGYLATQPAAHAQCNPQHVAKLLASDGSAIDWLGSSVAINGDSAIAGAPHNSDFGAGSGSAYIFERANGQWTQTAKLLASDGAADDFFGCSVSITDSVAIVGAFQDDDLGSISGSAYMFEKFGGAWIQVAKLTAADGLAMDQFGFSVSVSGSTAMVGSPRDDDRGGNSGSVYVFDKVDGLWRQSAKIHASDGAANDFFGCSVAIDGGTAIVGAYLDDDRDGESGSAYVFDRVDGNWTQVAKLVASDGAADDWFGYSVSVSTDAAVVGAYQNDDFGRNSGSAYVFERVVDTWLERSKLLPADGAADDWFGRSVAIDGNMIVVGMYQDDDRGRDSGSAYVFKRVRSGWSQVAKVLAEDGAAGDLFGRSVAIDGDTALIGVLGADDRGTDSGAAYVFNLNCHPRLTVLATCPAGGPISIDWSGATPNGSAALLYARDTGSFIVPNNSACAGTTLGLGQNQLQLITIVASDANGDRTLNSNTGPGTCGGYLQLLDISTCSTSNVARLE